MSIIVITYFGEKIRSKTKHQALKQLAERDQYFSPTTLRDLTH